MAHEKITVSSDYPNSNLIEQGDGWWQVVLPNSLTPIGPAFPPIQKSAALAYQAGIERGIAMREPAA